MSLLQRVFTERRGFVTAVSVILAIDVGVYAFAVYPWTNRVSQLEARRVAAGSELALVNEAYGVADETNISRTVLDGQLERFYAEVLPESLSSARNLLDPYLDDLADETNLVLERRTSTSNRERESLLAKLETTMVLAGAYGDIREFIHRLETSPEFILIEEVLLTRLPEIDGALVLTLGVSTYFREPTVITAAFGSNLAPNATSTDLDGEATVALAEESFPPGPPGVPGSVEPETGSLSEAGSERGLATSGDQAESVSAPAESEVGEYAVQVAAFTSDVTATALAKRLAMQGYASYVVEPVDDELPALYRVRIGHFSDRSSAEAMGQRVQDEEELDWYVVPQ